MKPLGTKAEKLIAKANFGDKWNRSRAGLANELCSTNSYAAYSSFLPEILSLWRASVHNPKVEVIRGTAIHEPFD